MAKTGSPPAARCVRDRLLDAADRLFYEEGVRAVGIDRVLAEASAAKASLYSHFGSKDELVAAYMDRRTALARDLISAFVDPAPPAERAARFFDWVVAWADSPQFRGCPMQHLVSEVPDDAHPARRIAATQRDWLHTRMLEWVTDAGADEPEALAGALIVLFDGAAAGSEQDGPRRARDARWLAHRMLAR